MSCDQITLRFYWPIDTTPFYVMWSDYPVILLVNRRSLKWRTSAIKVNECPCWGSFSVCERPQHWAISSQQCKSALNAALSTTESNKLTSKFSWNWLKNLGWINFQKSSCRLSKIKRLVTQTKIHSEKTFGKKTSGTIGGKKHFILSKVPQNASTKTNSNCAGSDVSLSFAKVFFFLGDPALALLKCLFSEMP